MSYQVAPTGTVLIATIVVSNTPHDEPSVPVSYSRPIQYHTERTSLTSGHEVCECIPTKKQLLITTLAYLAIAGAGLAVGCTADSATAPGQAFAGWGIVVGASVVYLAMLRCYFGIPLCQNCS